MGHLACLITFYLNKYVTVKKILLEISRIYRGKESSQLAVKVFRIHTRVTERCHGIIFSLTWPWVNCVGNRLDLSSWLGRLRRGCERDWVRLPPHEGCSILELSLPYLSVLGKAPGETVTCKKETLTQTGSI